MGLPRHFHLDTALGRPDIAMAGLLVSDDSPHIV
jgi:hypothetical protein